MSTDKLIRGLTTTAVLLVAAIAAVVSYVHIQHLAVTHGQTILPSVLLPLSIDGTVAAASLVMLRAARAGLATPPLARFMLVLSVIATLLANIAYGVPFGLAGALISGWPAVAFVGSVEMTIGMVRRTRGMAAEMANPLPVAEPGPPAVPLPQPSETPPPVNAPADTWSREGVQARQRKTPVKTPAGVPSDEERAAQLRTLLEAGEKVSITRAMDELNAGHTVAKRVRALALASNGSAPHD